MRSVDILCYVSFVFQLSHLVNYLFCDVIVGVRAPTVGCVGNLGGTGLRAQSQAISNGKTKKMQ